MSASATGLDGKHKYSDVGASPELRMTSPNRRSLGQARLRIPTLIPVMFASACPKRASQSRLPTRGRTQCLRTEGPRKTGPVDVAVHLQPGWRPFGTLPMPPRARAWGVTPLASRLRRITSWSYIRTDHRLFSVGFGGRSSVGHAVPIPLSVEMWHLVGGGGGRRVRRGGG